MGPLLRWYRLRREIKRFLIIVYPHTFALDQLDGAYRLPSLLGVLAGSSYFTCPPQILPVPRRHMVRLAQRYLGQHVVLC